MICDDRSVDIAQVNAVFQRFRGRIAYYLGF